MQPGEDSLWLWRKDTRHTTVGIDEFEKDRNKILTSIPKIIQQIKNINDEEKLKFLDELNAFVEGVEKKYREA